MMSPVVATLLSLTLACVGRGLKLGNFREHPHKHERNVTHREMVEWVPVANSTDYNSTSAQEIVQGNLSNQYCGCKGSSCFINSKKVKAQLGNDLILILGCSLDVYAIGYFCNAAKGIAMETLLYSSPLSYLAFCDVGQFTVAYAFHPGASAPPYAQDYNPALMGNTKDIVMRTKLDVKAKFGREPTAVVVDASLWDVGNWWYKSGAPAFPYPIAGEFVQQWSNKDVPDLLMFVAAMYPNTPIAFRTAPTIFSNPNSFGLSAVVVEQMVQCVETHKDVWGNVYGGFGLIDYHHVVDSVLAQATAPSMFYKDSLHPGPLLSLSYMNNMLAWVNARSNALNA